jgi:hypothetical protein
MDSLSVKLCIIQAQMSTRLIEVLKAGQKQGQAAFIYPGAPPWGLEIQLPGREPVTREGPDLFECLMRIRERLEPEGYQLLCNGSRRDCWASGMSRDMSGGTRLYLLTLGRRASKDTVFIFDEAPPELVGTVKEQREFYERWLGSFK